MESIDDVIAKSLSALDDESYSDAKKYVLEAVERANKEKEAFFSSYTARKEEKEKALARWYSKCESIFFQIFDYWNSLKYAYTASVFSEHLDTPPNDDERWIKLIYRQPRETLIQMKEKLQSFLSEDLGEIARLAVLNTKWKKMLEIVTLINFVAERFIELPYKHQTCLMKAKFYFNLNNQHEARYHCKYILENLCEYNDREALEIFARSLLETDNYKTALEHCKMALNCPENTSTDRERLQKLQAEIKSKIFTSAEKTESAADMNWVDNEHKTRSDRNSTHTETKRSKRHKRPKAKTPSKEHPAITLQKPLQKHIDNEQSNFDTSLSDVPAESEELEYVMLENSEKDERDSQPDDCNSSENCILKDANEAETIYQRSEKYYADSCPELADIIKENELMKNGLTLENSVEAEETCSAKMIYEPLLDVATLKAKLQKDPNRYIRCSIHINGPHESVCTPLEETRGISQIIISGRSKAGQTFMEDEVVVQMFDTCNKEKYGKVIGILERKRYKDINNPVFLCPLDDFETNFVRPICNTVPKIKVLSSDSRKSNFISVYKYDKEFILDSEKHVNEIKSRIALVALIKWSQTHQYPLGAVIKLLPQNDDLNSNLRLMGLQFKLPFLYHKNTLKQVSEMAQIDEPDMVDLQNRTDLTFLNVFTIDPKSSSDLDDAISIEQVGNRFLVGVHIADVASYIQKDSECDKEAMERATTFYSEISEEATRHMFPEPLSTNLLSLKPGKIRLTLSVFFSMDIEGRWGLEKICKSFVKSRRKLSYVEAQQMIMSINDESKLTRDIKQLHGIAKAVRYRRLGDAMFALNLNTGDLGEESPEKTFEARYLIEEFMTITNKTIAEELCQKYPGFVPLRCHPEPSKEKIDTFCEEYARYIDTVVKLQNKNINGPHKPCFKNVDDGEDPIFVNKQIWEAIAMKPGEALDYLRRDELFPLQFLVWQYWVTIQERACYVTGKENVTHFDLGTKRYVNCTSPIRRYNDLIIQRILHAHLEGRHTCPYEKNELTEIYKNINSRTRASVDYRRQCQILKLAFEIKSEPQMMFCIISDISDKGIELSSPQIARASRSSRLMTFNTLQVNKKPFWGKKERNTKWPEIEASWNKRIYTYSNHTCSTNEYTTKTRLNPHTNVITFQISRWAALLESAFSESMPNLKEKIKSMKIEDPYAGLMADDINIASENQLEVQPYVDFTMSYTVGQTVKVQMSAIQHKGNMMLRPVLYEMTDNIKMCLAHIDDPVMHLASYASDSTNAEYKSLQEYVQRWMPIILMEAATCSTRSEESIYINHVPLKVTDRKSGQFSLPVQFCETRHLQLNGLECVEDDENPSFHQGSNDWLCLKVSLPQAQVGAHMHMRPADRYVVAHAHVVDVSKTELEELQVTFELHRLSCFPTEIMGEGLANIEIIRKSDDDRRIIHYIQQLVSTESRVPKLPQCIALQRKIPPLDTERLKQAERNLEPPCEANGRPLPRNNDEQKYAIYTALKNRFTLIQGPPGTGKTNTAIKLIYLFDKINHDVSVESNTLKKKVMFCGPSNKSVDLVASLMLRYMGKSCLKIIRVYGQTIQEQDFPVPGHLPKKGCSKQAADDRLKSVTLHHLIRRDNRKYAKEIKTYDNTFKNMRFSFSQSSIRNGYSKLIKKASIDEIKGHDVILCTTSIACSVKVTKGADIQQIIIDEAAMCQEPQSLAPIIANKAEQVVLIGDHKQLKPIIICKKAADLGMETSLFERYASLFERNGSRRHQPRQYDPVLTLKGVKFIQLTEQYRMDPDICEFPSRMFYEGCLSTPRLMNVIWANGDQAIYTLGTHYPHVLIDVKGMQNIQNVSDEDGNDRSRSNHEEVKKVVQVHKHLIKSVRPDRIRILSQYNAQCSEIKNALREEYRQNVSTVVTSQGGEWDYVIFSTVCSLPSYMIEKNPSPGWCKQKLGFITDRNQINVALTRARKGLVIIGNTDLLYCDPVWKELIDSYDSKGCIRTADEFPPSVKNDKSRRTGGSRQREKARFRQHIPGLN